MSIHATPLRHELADGWPSRSLAAASGVVAPVLFAAALLVITWAEYDFMRESASA